MTSKEERRVVKSGIGFIIIARALLLVFVIIAALFAMVQTAEAKGVPTKLIIFTDKKVYTDAVNDPRTTDADNPTGLRPVPNGAFSENFSMLLYAVVLDDEGNILKGQSSNFTSRTVDDVKQLDHGTITDTATHHTNVISNPTYLDSIVNVPNLRDDGQVYDTYADDGIYTAFIDLPDFSINTGGSGGSKWDRWQIGSSAANVMDRTNSHLLVAVNVTFNNGVNPQLIETTYVLLTEYNCHGSFEGTHPNPHATSSDGAGTGFDPCDMCHVGYDHLYNYMNYSEFPSNFGDVAHANKLKPPGDLRNIPAGGNTPDIVYNTTYGGSSAPADQITTWSVFLNEGDTSDYCYSCHLNPGSGILDYQLGTTVRGDLNNRPSCSVASKSLRGGTANVGCHATTNITNASIIPWNQSAANTTHMLLDNTTAARSHNHSTSTPNLPCAGCHLTIHSIILPNKTSDKNINDQCKYCHSNTGPQNSTIMQHSSTTTDCKNCHKNATGVLDSHIVSQGIAGGVNCTECHNMGGNGNNVNFTTIGKGMHANLNKNAQSSAQNATNKPCWACHGTINATSGLANYSDQPLTEHNTTVYKNPRQCQDCHITGNLRFNATNVTDHIPSGYSSLTDVNTSSYNYTVCTYCHNNSVNYSNDTSMGLTANGNPINASVSHYGANKTAGKLMSATNNSTDCVYCHRNNSNMAAWGIKQSSPANISNKNGTAGTRTNHSDYTTSDKCKYCHGSYVVTASLTFHDAPLDNGSFGPDCKSCHDIGGIATGKLVNFSAMNATDAIHKNLNSLASATVDTENKKCWACHTINGTQPQESSNHSIVNRYPNPYNCTDCHVQGAGQNFNYTPNTTLLNVTRHYLNGGIIDTPSAATCYDCHNKTGMMIAAYDPDRGTVYGGINGGNNSSSHYGRKRADLVAQQNTTQYCYNCHNGSSVFPFLNNANRTIDNHTEQATNPVCANDNCHNGGRIHDSNLTKPSVNTTLCNYCHTNKARHNNSIECKECHLETNRSIHTVQYLQPDNTWKNNSAANRTSAVNCTNCHQAVLSSNFSNAPIIPATMKHSSALNNGSIWNTTPYWNNEQGSCYYCHNDTIHNSTALGAIDSIRSGDTNNTRNGAITATTWCVDCHLNSGNTKYKGNLWSPMPPLITVNNTLKSDWEDHSTYLGSGIKDKNCESCHAQNITAAETSLNYSHSLDEGIAGSPNCIQCHNLVTGLSGGAPSGINFTAFNQSIHFGMNSVNSTTNGACWACHDSDGNVTSGHPDRKITPKACTECHLGSGTYNASAYNALVVGEHYYGGTNIKAGNSTSNITSCINCHENTSGMVLYNNDTDTGTSFTGDGIRQNGGNQSAYHYGRNRTDLRTLDSGKATNCSYCHQDSNTVFNQTMVNAGYNSSIQNHSSANAPTCINSTCHASGWIHNATLTKPTLPLPNTTYCQNCHADKNAHNSTQQCTKCHVDNTSSDTIHPVKFVQTTGTFGTGKSTAANCTNCHQAVLSSNFSNAPIIPATMKHSSALNNGSIWNTTPYWNNEQGSCYYCHNDTIHNSTALGAIDSIRSGDTNNTRNGAITATTWCVDCHLNSGNTKYKGNLWSPMPPLITVNNTLKSDWEDHSTYLGSGIKDKNCESCHAQNITAAETSLNYSHSLDEGIAGSPNCIQCHNLVTGLSGGAPSGINFTAFNQSIHFGMNSVNSTTNGACWACHDTDGNVTSGHGDKQKTPKLCDECHLESGTYYTQSKNWKGLTVSVHYYGSTVITAGNSTSNITSCINCHENISEMIQYNNDTDSGSFAGDGIGITGGNKSAYHYGRNRTDLRQVISGKKVANCYYCHQNNNTAFVAAMQYPSVNKSILNHTNTIPTSAICSNINCHDSGWIHNSTLTKPVFTNADCNGCHVENTHNGVMNCWNCHQDPNGTMYQTVAHGMMYPQANGTYKIYDKGTPANCTTCHVYNLVNTSENKAILIPALNHSTDTYSGKKWGSYWDNTSMITACYYCHQVSIHLDTKSALLGNVTAIQGTNTYNNADLTASTWCANCHYSGAPAYGGGALASPPPEITNSSLVSSDGTAFYNHSTDMASNYNDSKCIECHSLAGSYTSTTLNFSHGLNEGGGGPDCVSSGCHGTAGSDTSPYMNWTSLKTGMHAGLNSGAVNTTSLTDLIDKACWACHGDGTQPSGHPSNYKQPYNCTACHLASGNISGKYQTKNVTEHQHVDAQVLTNSTYARCENCHNNSLVPYSDNETSPATTLTNYTSGNVSHYGANKTAGKLMYNSSGNSEDCVYCHLNNSNRQKWANATNVSATKPDIHGSFNVSTSSSKCWECHVDSGVPGVTSGFTLHNSSLNPGASEFCLTCHVEGGSASNLNVTGTKMGAHINLNNTPVDTLNNSDCWTCHFGYPNGVAGSHSYNVSSQNTYYCKDCHGPVKNGTAVSKGIDAETNIISEFQHASLDCAGCHAANDSRRPGGARVSVYHNSSAKMNATGVVSNPGWDVINGLYADCNDCHRIQNTRTGPFRGPGYLHYTTTASNCGDNNCHAYDNNPHFQVYQPCYDFPACYLQPSVSPPSVSNLNLTSPVVNKTISTTTLLTAKAWDNYNIIENAKYRISNSSGTVVNWTEMDPSGGRWGPTRLEQIRATIDASNPDISPGLYTVEVKAMAGGPRTKPGRYYPDNGEWSSIASIMLEVKQ